VSLNRIWSCIIVITNIYLDFFRCHCISAHSISETCFLLQVKKMWKVQKNISDNNYDTPLSKIYLIQVRLCLSFTLYSEFQTKFTGLHAVACTHVYDRTQPNTHFLILSCLIPSKHSGCSLDDSCSLCQNVAWALKSNVAETLKHILCIKHWMRKPVDNI
jgi:hypothetical protein